MKIATRLSELSDQAAIAEANRLIAVTAARFTAHARWMGLAYEGKEVVDAQSGFVVGMTALFRYARGESVPSPIVETFLDELLTLMFAGLGSGALALPSFQRMQDRPWAIAWRLAELRLFLERGEGMDRKQFAHLVGTREDEVASALERNHYPRDGKVPPDMLRAILLAIDSERSDVSSSALHND